MASPPPVQTERSMRSQKNEPASPVNMVATLKNSTLTVTTHLREKRSPIHPPTGTITAKARLKIVAIRPMDVSVRLSESLIAGSTVLNTCLSP